MEAHGEPGPRSHWGLVAGASSLRTQLSWFPVHISFYQDLWILLNSVHNNNNISHFHGTSKLANHCHLDCYSLPKLTVIIIIIATDTTTTYYFPSTLVASLYFILSTISKLTIVLIHSEEAEAQWMMLSGFECRLVNIQIQTSKLPEHNILIIPQDQVVIVESKYNVCVE